MPRSRNATQRRMNQIHEDDLEVAAENPTNADLARRLDEVDRNNTKEHQEVKDALDDLAKRFGSIEKLVAAHEQTLYGRESEGGLMREHAKVKEDIVQTDTKINNTIIGGTLTALSITIGIIAAKMAKLI